MEIEDSARTMFARHKLYAESENSIRWLRENGKHPYIAIHWEDYLSTDENDYGNNGKSRAYQEIRRMRRVAREEEDPVIVGAYYGGKVDEFRDSMVVGRVDPDADVHIIHDREEEEPVAYESEQEARDAGVPEAEEDGELEDESIYKALPLTGCKAYDEPRVISFTDYPLLSAVHPRSHSFCNWDVAEQHLKAIDAGLETFRDVEQDVSDSSDRLAPSQLEVVCNEYLRRSDDEGYGDYVPTLPVGRTLRDVDIVGQTDDGLLFAQVTKEDDESDLKEKGEKLASYERDSDVELVFFGPDEMDEEELLPEEVDYESVKEVAEEVDRRFSDFIDAMYRLPEPASI